MDYVMCSIFSKIAQNLLNYILKLTQAGNSVMVPKQIKIFEKSKLMISWPDNNVYYIDLHYLRDECPCAGCKGETVLLKTYRPAKKANDNPEMYKIKDIQIVGGYGIQITWKDGHK